jgi:hypothetical protein
VSTLSVHEPKQTARRSYRPRGTNILQRLFRERFSAFASLYDEKYSSEYGKFRLPLIERAVEAFRLCGDWRQGIARVRCPDCAYDFFVPFSCKSFHLCPSCGQKRTLLLGEYLSEDLLLQLPHRQFVFTIPKALRVYLKHDRTLPADVSRLIFRLLSDYFSETATRKITAGMVSSLQTFGEYASWHPHWHTIVLEGGFDRWDRFVFIPIGASDELVELWRVRVVEFFSERKLINADFAKKLLGWKHSGFSIESDTRINLVCARRARREGRVCVRRAEYDR